MQNIQKLLLIKEVKKVKVKKVKKVKVKVKDLDIDLGNIYKKQIKYIL
jgi:hypothetical protein